MAGRGQGTVNELLLAAVVFAVVMGFTWATHGRDGGYAELVGGLGDTRERDVDLAEVLPTGPGGPGGGTDPSPGTSVTPESTRPGSTVVDGQVVPDTTAPPGADGTGSTVPSTTAPGTPTTAPPTTGTPSTEPTTTTTTTEPTTTSTEPTTTTTTEPPAGGG